MTNREIDALFTEHVMGLVPCQAACHTPGHKFYLPGPCHAMPDSPDQGDETPCYSTDIAAAMQGIEKEREAGREWQITTGTPYTVGNQTDEGLPLMGWEWEERFDSVERDSLPMAICIAILRSRGVEVER